MPSNLPTLPAGWEWKRFHELFDSISSKSFQINASKYQKIGKIPVIDQSQNFIAGYSDETDKIFKNESEIIIFGDHTRQFKYIDFDFVIGADGTKILDIKNKSNNFLKFFYYQFLAKEIKSLGYSRHFKVLKEMSYTVPALNEQKRLVSLLDTLFAKIDRSIELLSENITAADALLPSALNTVFGELGEKYSLNELTKVIEGKIQNGLYKHKDYYNENGTKILRIDNFYNGKVNATGIKRLSLTNDEIEKYLLNENDIVINRVNSIEYLGKCAFIDKQIEPMVFESNMMKFSVNEITASMYIVYMLQCSQIKEQVEKKAKRAINQCSINQTDVNTLLIPLPPLDIQTKTVEYLDSVRHKVEILKRVQNDKINNLKALKASILDRAFKGEL